METVLITGANRGIGYELTRQYLLAGKRVIATCRNPKDAENLSALGDQHFERLFVYELDAASESSIYDAFKQIKTDIRKIDILISNAGINLREELGNWSSRAFAESMQVNAIGPALLAQAFEPMLFPGSKMICISSRAGSLEAGGFGGDAMTSYAMSKAALNMLTRRLCKAWKENGIIVTSISPGYVRTDMTNFEANLGADESAAAMIQTIDGLGDEASGNFYGHDGTPIPW